jgi:arsenate reductase
MAMYPTLLHYLQTLSQFSVGIPADRQKALDPLVSYLQEGLMTEKAIRLQFICTHNARRSQFGQAWAYVLSRYFGLHLLESHSGGTMATACHPQVIHTLEQAGFEFSLQEAGDNPQYLLRTDEGDKGIRLFSKTFDAPQNPSHDFVAIMVCSQADEACPFVPGARLKISLPYQDPGRLDGTPDQASHYQQTSHQIASELCWAFRQAPLP